MKQIKSFETAQEKLADQTKIHLSHCFQGEYEDCCKYGSLDCPAEKETGIEIRQGDVVTKNGNNYLVVQSLGKFATVTDYPILSVNRLNWSLDAAKIHSCSTLETRTQAQLILSRSRFK